MKACNQCGYQFSPVSTRYYCCNQQKPVCITCRRKACKQCRNFRTTQLLIPQCGKCLSRLDESGLLFEYNCGTYFCSRCVSSIFKNAYQKVSIQQAYNENEEVYVKMYCGHQYPYNALLSYFLNFCTQCGRDYDGALDYQMDSGAKLCYMCFKYDRFAYEKCFLKCMSCDGVLQNSSKAEVVQSQQLVLCTFCANTSIMQQSQINQNKKADQREKSAENLQDSLNQPIIEEERPVHNILNNTGLQESQLVIEQIKQHQQNKRNTAETQDTQPVIEQNKPTQPKQQRPPHPVETKRTSQKQASKTFNNSVNAQISPTTIKGEKSPTSRFIRKPSINELKQKQEQRQKSMKQNEGQPYSVTSKFQEDTQYFDQETTKDLGVPGKIKMKRHLSNETFVQNFKLQVPQTSLQDYSHCQSCNNFVLVKLLFNPENANKSRDLSSSRLFDFEQLNSTKSTIDGKTSVCRVCYFKSKERQKSLNNNSFISEIKSAKSIGSRSSRMTENKQSSQFLKVGSPLKRYTRSPSATSSKLIGASPMKYSLTGSIVSQGKSQNSDYPTKMTSDYIQQQSTPKPTSSYKYSASPNVGYLNQRKSANSFISQPNIGNSSQKSSANSYISQANLGFANQKKQNDYGQQYPKVSLSSIPSQKPFTVRQPAQQKPTFSKMCALCKKPSQSVVVTLSQGHVCTECYYRKSPHTYKPY